MLFLNQKPGESLVLETPTGRIVIRILDGRQVGIELPPGVDVLDEGVTNERRDNWLPARPSSLTT